ncbi:putative cyclin-dependent kinase F-2 [Brachypodium distachyon]|uniref:[RNA-polymerase]-subunit kinase n=1 Tax=Brachypodium distachyon TaxID=15368 RepID=I1GT41_BRADI|nr:putative cyclin-dependent kinase F-2 [Brachypodium distachyon]KQK15573.1 hypothetical protein BRADI_1g23762v3 [Brachypodium distachyon]|eukprot:XP_003560045.1 putative cyclin-dependent kinase F-2 [Brachypodium distachyon]
MAVKRSAAAFSVDDSARSSAPTSPTAHKRRRVYCPDDYEETGVLGEGGFGVVVSARHRATGELVAVKALHSSSSSSRSSSSNRSSSSDAAVSGLMREASFLAACRGHPSLIGLHSVSRDPSTGELSIIMDYAAGPSLHDVLHVHRGSRPFPEAEVRGIMKELLGGAEHLHAQGIVHRDIKPENILVIDNNGGIKICDLGLAMSTASDAPPYTRCGTVPYMAPEVLLGMPDYGAMVDTWSLGCVMAELLAGERLFDGDEPGAQMLEIFDVLGAPGCSTWPAYKSLPLAGKLAKPPRCIRSCRRLRKLFPEEVLSREGYQVLRGLLSCNIDKRLSATAALRLPWFTNSGDASAV